MLKSPFLVRMISVSLMVLSAGMVSAQDYPNKPIRIISGSVGGGSDFIARQIAQGISGPLGQPVIVDNRGSGILPMEQALKASSDGYTLLVYGAANWILPLLQKVPYDPERDFSPISLLVREVNVLVVNPSVPANSVKELIALAKARPGELNYGTGASGGTPHLGAELFKSMAGVNIVHVTYKGQAQAITGVISGEVQLTINDAGQVAPHVKSGKLRALAVTSATPSALTPGLPTLAASGLPGYESIGMSGIWAPAKTPGAIISRLNREAVRFLTLPEVNQRFLSAGEEIVASSPEQFVAAIKTDMAKMGKVIKDAGIKLD
jgi:tripartite-type tricarboxylate transporter receptor subunit TctC